MPLVWQIFAFLLLYHSYQNPKHPESSLYQDRCCEDTTYGRATNSSSALKELDSEQKTKNHKKDKRKVTSSDSAGNADVHKEKKNYGNLWELFPT